MLFSDFVHNFLEVLTMSLQSNKKQFETDLLLPTSDFPPAHFQTRGEGECTFHYFFFETTHFHIVVKNILRKWLIILHFIWQLIIIFTRDMVSGDKVMNIEAGPIFDMESGPRFAVELTSTYKFSNI